MDTFLTYSHIVAGSTALLSGMILMLRPKGTRLHVALGWVYAIAMFWICLSALSIITFYRFSFFLMVVGVLTAYSTFVGIRVNRRRQLGSQKWYDWMASIITCLCGLGLYGYAIYVFSIAGWHWVGMLSLIFGTLTLVNGGRDIKFFIQGKSDDPKWWFHQHINAMGSSYIAAVTAFVVQNGDHWMPENSVQWLFWVLPGAIGGTIIGRVIARSRKKMRASQA